MAKYQNMGFPPGSFRPGYEFFMKEAIAEFPPDVVPSKGWVPLDEEAVKVMQAAGIPVKGVGDASHLKDYVGNVTASTNPRSAREDDSITLSEMARTGGAVTPAGGKVVPPAERPSNKKI